MTNFVLVHGTAHGGWCSRSLSPLLRAAGHEVYTPTLTGLGASSHLAGKIPITLATHIEDVTNTLFYEDLSEVVLVGHSYAGMVITGVAAKQPERLAHLVYLDAYLPNKGEREIDLWPQNEAYQSAREEIERGETLHPVPSNFAAIMGITDPELVEWAKARFTPQPLSTYKDAPPAGSAESSSISRTYIHCTVGSYASIMQVFASRAQGFGWKVYNLSAGHDAMLTHPKELAYILLEVANSLSGQTAGTDPHHL